jgi:hypothetical protein
MGSMPTRLAATAIVAGSVVATASCHAAGDPLPPRKTPRIYEPPANAPLGPAAPATAAPSALLASTRADAEKRAPGVSIELASSEPVVWPDGSLGCGKPGQRYTMAPVPGWRIVYRGGEREYAYHARTSGYFVYCETPGRRNEKAPGDRSPGAFGRR